MPCLHPQLENPESFLMAHTKIFQSHNRKVGNYCAKSVVISHVLPRRRFLFGDEHKFAAGNQQRCCGTKFSLISIENSRPLDCSQQRLTFGSIRCASARNFIGQDSNNLSSSGLSSVIWDEFGSVPSRIASIASR